MMLHCLRHVSGKPTRAWAGTAAAALAALAAALLIGCPGTATAKVRHGTSIEVAPRPAGPPIMAVVSLGGQRITIYDADGWIMRAPVSSGQTGYETPAGIYSVLQKEVEHYSNLYDDASMPYMQRLTWSGIALHAGILPGYPASHGCVRMPHDFAEHLYDLTKIGLRVIVTPSDVAPAPAEDDHLFKPRPVRGEATPGKPVTLQSIAAAKAAEAEAAGRKAQAARMAANRMTWDIARAQSLLRLAESALARADVQLGAAESTLNAAGSAEASARAQDAKILAEARVLDARLRLEAAMVQADSKPDVAGARAAADAAEAERAVAVAAAKEAARRARPISIFVSRKTQHLYVRQSFEPLFDSPVTIRDAEQPIGTHIFTALGYTDTRTDLRWNIVSMPHSTAGRDASPRERRHRDDGHVEPSPQDSGSAIAALDRVVIPQDALDRISELVSPGSSLIISDEGVSSETGDATDFVVLMSGEPQGGIKIRRHGPEVSSRSDRRQYRNERGYADRAYSSPYYYYGRSYYRGYYYGGNSYSGGLFGGYNRF